ncbi:MAG: hypothetical protein HRT61_23930, partial [Ekhidna sp.]|nr:hypothetical protein [Ekhidna sp.]
MAQKYVVLFLVYMISYSAQSQEKIKMNADSIIDNFIEIIGGDKWKNLESRIEKGFVENHRDQASNNPIPQTSTRTTYYKAPHYFLEYKDSFFQGKLVLTYQPECNWYYSQKVPLLYFFGPDPIKFESKFPRTELLEAFNLKAKEQVYIVDSLVRVDFLDKRRKDGVLS